MTKKEQEEKAERDQPASVTPALATATGAFNTKQPVPPFTAREVKSNEYVPLGPARISKPASLNGDGTKTIQSKLTPEQRAALEQAVPTKPSLSRTDSPSQQSASKLIAKRVAEECRDLAELLEKDGAPPSPFLDESLERAAKHIALLQSARRLNLP